MEKQRMTRFIMLGLSKEEVENINSESEDKAN